MEKKESKAEVQAKYTKEVILKAEKLIWNRDVLQVLLDDEKEYTLDEVEALVDAFNKREVN